MKSKERRMGNEIKKKQKNENDDELTGFAKYRRTFREMYEKLKSNQTHYRHNNPFYNSLPPKHHSTV